MKKTLLFSCICYLFGSCSPTVYQISAIQSDNVKMQNNSFSYGDSIFKITYNLWSNGGQMDFIIYNKSDVPVYIDWTKSNFIVEDKSLDDWQDNTVIKTNGDATTAGSWWSVPYSIFNPSKLNYSSISLQTSTSIISKTKPDNQIPPHSYIERTTFNIQYPYFIPNRNIKNRDSLVTTCDSCFRFRNYIAWTKNEDLSKLKFIDNDFQVYKIVSIVNRDYWNDALFDTDHKKTNSFYTKGQFIYQGEKSVIGVTTSNHY